MQCYHFLNVLEMKAQKVALQWQWEFVKCAGREMLPFLSNMLQAILPILSHSGDMVDLAREVNLELQELITEVDDERPAADPMGVVRVQNSNNLNTSHNAAESLTSVSSSDDQDSLDQ